MSLARLALRLAAYEALNPYATIAAGPWPTLAGRNVYDTRVDPIDEPDTIAALLAQIEGQPIVSLYTEEDEGEPYAGADYPVDKEVVTLVAELMIAARGALQVEQADGSIATIGAITAPVTDRQHEALLDVLEAQVRRLFDPQSVGAPSTALLQSVVYEAHHIHSIPQRAADRVTRLAARTVKFRLRVKTTRWPLVPVSPAPTGLALLPQPLLDVATGLDPASSGGQLCAAVALLLQQPAPLTPLQGVNVFASLGRGSPPIRADGLDSDIRNAADTVTSPPAPILNRLWARAASWLAALINWSPS